MGLLARTSLSKQQAAKIFIKSFLEFNGVKFDENVEKGGFFKKAKDEIVAKFDKELLIKFDDKGRISEFKYEF